MTESSREQGKEETETKKWDFIDKLAAKPSFLLWGLAASVTLCLAMNIVGEIRKAKFENAVKDAIVSQAHELDYLKNKVTILENAINSTLVPNALTAPATPIGNDSLANRTTDTTTDSTSAFTINSSHAQIKNDDEKLIKRSKMSRTKKSEGIAQRKEGGEANERECKRETNPETNPETNAETNPETNPNSKGGNNAAANVQPPTGITIPSKKEEKKVDPADEEGYEDDVEEYKIHELTI